MQGVVSNYDTDLFVPLIQRAAELTALIRKRAGKRNHQRRLAARHRRPQPRCNLPHQRRRAACNEGRGYVLRKIIRRASATDAPRPDPAVPLQNGRGRGKGDDRALPRTRRIRRARGKDHRERRNPLANTLAVGLAKLQDLLDHAETVRCKEKKHSSSTTPSVCRWIS